MLVREGQAGVLPAAGHRGESKFQASLSGTFPPSPAIFGCAVEGSLLVSLRICLSATKTKFEKGLGPETEFNTVFRHVRKHGVCLSQV